MMSNFRKPDLNAPRYRPKVLNVLNKELWKSFLIKYPQYKGLTYKNFKKIIGDSNRVLWENVINNRDGVELPESLGFIFLGSCYVKNKNKVNINYGKSIKEGIKISNNNWESDGLLGKIFYTNYSVKYKVQDRQIWTFVPCRYFKRSVAKEYPENWTKYVKVDDRMKVSRLYTKITYKNYLTELTNKNLVNYNEFDLD
jgi:hypothetical protein